MTSRSNNNAMTGESKDKMTSRSKDIDGGWAWPVLLASYFNLLMCSGLAFVAGMFQVVFLEEFQESVALTSWITALFSSQMQLAGPLSSAMANQFSCRVAVMSGGICLTLGLALSSLVDTLPLLFLSFGVLAGLGLGLAYSASVIVVNYYFDQRRTMVTGIALSASGLGIILAPQVSTILFKIFHWRESLVILSAIAAQMCIFAAIMFPMHERNSKNDCAIWWRLCPGTKRTQDAYTPDIGQENTIPLNSCAEDTTHVYESPLHSKTSLGVSEDNKIHNDSDVYSKVDAKQTDVKNAEEVLKENSIVEQNIEHEHKHQCFEKIPDQKSSLIFNQVEKDASENPKPFPVNASMNGSGHIPTKHQNKMAVSTGNGVHHITLNGPVTVERIHDNKTRSHDELPRSARLLSPSSKTKGFSTQELAMKHSLMALNSHKPHHHHHPHHSSQKVLVVSRNPSLLSMLTSTRHLEIIKTETFDHSSDVRSTHSHALSHHSLLDHEIVITDSRRSSIVSESSKTLNILEEEVLPSQSYPSLLKNITFWVLCLQLFLANCACGVFNIHLPSFAYFKGLNDQDMTNVLSVNGMGILMGRCMVGALANATHHDFLIYWALHILGGIVVMLYPVLANTFWSMSVLTICVALYYGSVYSVLTSITIRCVGLSQLATAFGLEMVCAGLGYLVAPPMAGLLVDWTGSYDYDMYCGGALLVLSSLVLMILPVLDAKVIDSQESFQDDTSQCDNDPEEDA